MLKPYVYSPMPASAYVLHGLHTCEARSLMEQDPTGAAWNLHWLTNPTVDQIPGSGASWWKHYKLIDGQATACLLDALGDEVLGRKLLMHPLSFAAWFEREDHSIYDLYTLLGPTWVDTVMIRAHDAARRLTAETPAITRAGNVYHLVFGKKAA